MQKLFFLINYNFIILSLIILSVLFVPLSTYAGTFYSCVDKKGNETLSDYPIGGKTCKPIGEFKKMTDEEQLNYEKEKEEKTKKWDSEDKKRKADEEVKKKYIECIKRADDKYKSAWDEQCIFEGKLSNCSSISNFMAKRLDATHQQEKYSCEQRYPQKP